MPESRGTRAHDQVFVREGERCWFVAVSEIRRLVVDGNYTRLWFRDQNALLTRSLSALEARLPPDLSSAPTATHWSTCAVSVGCRPASATAMT